MSFTTAFILTCISLFVFVIFIVAHSETKRRQKIIEKQVPKIMGVRLEICEFNVDPNNLNTADTSTLRYYLRRIYAMSDGSESIRNYYHYFGENRQRNTFDSSHWVNPTTSDFTVFDDYKKIRDVYLNEYSLLARQYHTYTNHKVKEATGISIEYVASSPSSRSKPKSPDDELFELGDMLRKNNVPTELPPVSNMNL